MTEHFNQRLADGTKPYWIWGPLVFSGFFFLPTVFSFDHFSWQAIVASVAIYLCFLALYIKAVFTPGEKVALPIFLMLLLFISGTYITPGTQSLFGFAAYFCGFNFSRNKGIQGLIGILLGIFLSAYLFNFYDFYFTTPAVIISIALFFFGSAERRDRIHQQKENLSQQKIEQLATIAERERIARDLHDLVGHSLSSIALKAELAQKLMNAEKIGQAKQEISAVAELSRQILAEVRQAVSGLKHRSLAAQIEKLSQELKQQEFDVEINNSLSELPADIESTLTLILTEAVTNILRHSQGDKVKLELAPSSLGYHARISDNGMVSDIVRGNGLKGIQERCQALKGSFSMEHQNGCVLDINLPGGQA